jgi:hypothetical protein
MSTDLTTPKKAGKSAVSSLTLGSADDALTLATELQKFVKANKLTSNIQGKEFPNVEAWQFAGSLLGLSPMLESIEDKSVENGEIKWHATVAIQNLHTGTIVGRGFATCSNKEHTKRSFADYAICSMAQTRAVGKAYRLSLGWLMKAAGYEATPAEEMQEVGTSAAVVAEPTPWTDEREAYSSNQLRTWKAQFADAKSKVEVREIWNSLPVGVQPLLKQHSLEAAARIDAAILQAAGTPVV